ncbi:MAG: RsmD family RNA methyltransferase [Polyangiales bacterium]
MTQVWLLASVCYGLFGPTQIEWRLRGGRSEVMRIVGGRLSGRRFGAPGGRATRPTSDRVREAIASALQSRGGFDDARVLDLFAGTGAFSFEALSRGASNAVLVDLDARAIGQVVQSARELGLSAQTRTLRVNLLGEPTGAIRKIPAMEQGFTLLFADAPYAEIDAVPPLLEALIASARLTPGALVVIEHPASHDWTWPNGLASIADYRYGQTGISLGVYAPEKGTQ